MQTSTKHAKNEKRRSGGGVHLEGEKEPKKMRGRMRKGEEEGEGMRGWVARVRGRRRGVKRGGENTGEV